MDDYIEKLNNRPNVDDNVLTIFIHFWNATIPVRDDNNYSLEVQVRVWHDCKQHAHIATEWCCTCIILLSSV